MKVYILICYLDSGTKIEGVYSTEDKAKFYRKEILNTLGLHAHIEPSTIDRYPESLYPSCPPPNCS